MRGRAVMRGWGIVGAATAVSLLAGTAYATGGTTAAAAPGGGSGSVASVAAPVGQQGFVPVRQLAYQPLAGVSPAKGELWLVGLAAYGQPMTLEHLRGGRWTTEQLPAYPGGAVSMAATAHDDVWLTAGGTLRHYTGAAWKSVATPTGPDGKPLQAGTLATGPGGALYVGMSDGPVWGLADHLFRYQRGRWTDLGSPAPADNPYPDTRMVKIVAVDAGISVLTHSQHTSDAYDLVGGTWSAPRRVQVASGATEGTVGAYVVTGGLNHLVLGGAGFSGLAPKCLSWTPKADVPCTTTVVAGAGARLANGSLILGGDDYTTPIPIPVTGPQTHVEGRFVLRGADGVERPLAGDPGAGATLMIPEAHRNAAWAVTLAEAATGPRTYTLQRYAG